MPMAEEVLQQGRPADRRPEPSGVADRRRLWAGAQTPPGPAAGGGDGAAEAAVGRPPGRSRKRLRALVAGVVGALATGEVQAALRPLRLSFRRYFFSFLSRCWWLATWQTLIDQ